MKYPVLKARFRSRTMAESYLEGMRLHRGFYAFVREYRGTIYIFTNSLETKCREEEWRERLKTR